ncbi:unnamed protein product, partial [Candidula unifasciata]
LDLVTVPSREVRQYKLQYVCCDGDTECKEADNVHAPGFDTTDEKFLAIVLGSTAACVVIIIIIFAVTFYTKKSRCQTICDQENHVYASAGKIIHDFIFFSLSFTEVEDVPDPNAEEKHQPEDIEGEKDYKCSDAEYAEICDSRLPRYTDIFKDSVDEKGSPFNKATAPPMYSAVNPKEYINTEITPTAPADDVMVVSGAEPNLKGEFVREVKQKNHSGSVFEKENNERDVLYYNVGEKMEKKRNSGGFEECASTTKVDRSNIKMDVKGEAKVSGKTASISLRNSNRQSKQNNPSSLEMMVKSSSASETIGKISETALSKQKRRSAPPGSIDASSVGYMYGHQGSLRSASSSTVIRSSSNNTCTVIHEAAPLSQRDSDKRQKTKNSRENLQHNSVRKTSQGSSLSQVGHSLKKSSSHSLSIRDLKTSNRAGSPPKDLEDDSEPAPATENDSLLRSSSCHSGCGDGNAFTDCEHCSKYDRINRQPDPETCSLHIYQCLDEVRKECEGLRAASAAAGLKTLGLETSVINNESSGSSSQTMNSTRQLQC